jgi:carbon-monoxide dehydrogenase medium subunit
MQQILPKLTEYFRPTSLAAAIALLSKGKGCRAPLAGGTSLTLSTSRKITGLVDLADLKLRYIKESQRSIRIGATSVMRDLCTHPALARLAGGVLQQAARAVGATPTRNLVTLGGNIVQVFFWSTLPVALLALDATIRVQGKAGRRSVSAEDFFHSHPKSRLACHELVTEVVVPKASSSCGGAFIKFALTHTGYALLNVACVLERSSKACRNVRLVIGAATALPFRLQKVEAMLENEPLTESLLEHAKNMTTELVGPVPDMRADPEYRKALAGVLVQRAIQQAWESANKNHRSADTTKGRFRPRDSRNQPGGGG